MDDIEDIVAEIEMIGDIGGSELEESYDVLAHCWSRRDGLSVRFVRELELEMRSQLKWFHENCKIVEVTSINTEVYKTVEMLS